MSLNINKLYERFHFIIEANTYFMSKKFVSNNQNDISKNIYM